MTIGRRFALLLFVLFSCEPGERSGATDAQPAAIAASEYCETIAPFFCDFYLRCGRMVAESAEECRSNFLTSCNSDFEGAYQELEALGYLNLDPQGVTLCKEHLDAVDCQQQIFELSGPCAQVWTGHQPVGASCGLDVEYFVCDAASECVLNLDFCGTCRALIPLGGACSPGEDTCGAEAYCRDNICLERKRNGESCGEDDRCFSGSSCTGGQCVGPSFVALGDACDRDNRCPYMSECIGGSCQVSVLIGAACDATTTCAAGYCDGVCKEPQVSGASCDGPDQCRSGLCADGQCQPRPSACLR